MSEAKQKTLRFKCPSCSVVLKGKLSDAGKQRKCPKCNQKFKIPRPKVAEGSSAPKKEQELIPVVCGLCQTRMYATYDQIGHSIECPDCFTQSLVKEPKHRPKKVQPDMTTGSGYDLEPEKEVVVTKDLSEDLLQKADEEVQKKIEEEPDIPKRPFLSGVFFYPFYGRIFPVLLGMALAWTGVAAFAKFTVDLMLNQSLTTPIFFAALGILLLFAIFPTLVSYQKMFENTSVGDEESDCRPAGGLFAFIDWVGETMPLLIAGFIACAPGMIVIQLAQLRPEYYVGMVFSAYLIFPVLFISMLESASVTGVFSKPVLTSFAKVPGMWFKFYSLIVMVFAIGLAAVAGLGWGVYKEQLTGNAAAIASVGAILVVLACLAIYFRLMGRLALLMSHKILVEVDMPDEESSHDELSPEDAEVSLGV